MNVNPELRDKALTEAGLDPSVWDDCSVEAAPAAAAKVTAACSDLTDDEWERMAMLIPEKYLKRPRATERYRNLFDGLLWLSRRCACETCLPLEYGSYQSLRKLREAMGLRGDMGRIALALPGLGLSPERTAALIKICVDAQRRGNSVLARRRRFDVN